MKKAGPPRMDIRKWLAEIELPVRSGRSRVEGFEPERKVVIPGAGRRRKRSSSDSSLLKAQSPQPGRRGISVGEHTGHAAQGFDRTLGSPPHLSRSDSSHSGAKERPYARKSRRKTRPEKYTAASKRREEKAQARRPNRKNESKKSKHKSEQKKDYSGVEREVQAEKLSKDRLTLKPLGKVGLFGKGKSSTSFRGGGLPDLVFSEMKFLRNDGGKNKSSKDVLDVQRRRKKDNPRTKEEDISAFFTSARSVLADKDRDVKPRSECAATKTQRSERRRAPSIQPEAIVLTTESGKRQSQLDSNASHPRQKSTSYISLSESVRASGSERQTGRKTEQVRRSDTPSQTKPDVRFKRHAALRQQHVPSSLVYELSIDNADLARAPPIVPVPTDLSDSQSLPGRSFSHRRMHFVDRAAGGDQVEEVVPLSSTSPVLGAVVGTEKFELPRTKRSNKRPYMGRSKSTQEQGSTGAVSRLVSHESPRRSTSLGEVLQQCNNMESWEARPHTMNIQRFNTDHEARDSPRRSAAQGPRGQAIAPDAHTWRWSNFLGPSFYEQQERRQRLPVPSDFQNDVQLMEFADDGYVFESDLLSQDCDDEMWDEPVSCKMDVIGDEVGAGLDYDAYGVEDQMQTEHGELAGMGFWRPNKLY